MLTIRPAELGDGIDEAVVEVGRPAEPRLGVRREHHAGPAAVPVQPQPAATARCVLGGGDVGSGAASVVDQAGEHLPRPELTCAFRLSAPGPSSKPREGEKDWSFSSDGCSCSSPLSCSLFCLCSRQLTLSERVFSERFDRPRRSRTGTSRRPGLSPSQVHSKRSYHRPCSVRKLGAPIRRLRATVFRSEHCNVFCFFSVKNCLKID
jgi:hypothetical protein